MLSKIETILKAYRLPFENSRDQFSGSPCSDWTGPLWSYFAHFMDEFRLIERKSDLTRPDAFLDLDPLFAVEHSVLLCCRTNFMNHKCVYDPVFSFPFPLSPLVWPAAQIAELIQYYRARYRAKCPETRLLLWTRYDWPGKLIRT
jgi:hypothetical protein